MSPEEIALVDGLCRDRAGLAVAANAYLIESRLEPVARAEGLAGVSGLLAAVRGAAGEGLTWKLVEAMTCADTGFFDDKSLFDALETELLPRLARARSSAPVKVWSAACSTGQEVYSLAMLADHLRLAGGEARLDLAASDLSSGAIERAKRGLYSQFEVQRGLPIRLLVQHFEKVEDMWRVSPALRRQVRWRRINLIDDLSRVGTFDVIFCRNVLSGMDPAFRSRVLAAIAKRLPEDGLLVMGARENASYEGFMPFAGHSGVFCRADGRHAAAA